MPLQCRAFLRVKQGSLLERLPPSEDWPLLLELPSSALSSIIFRIMHLRGATLFEMLKSPLFPRSILFSPSCSSSLSSSSFFSTIASQITIFQILQLLDM